MLPLILILSTSVSLLVSAAPLPVPVGVERSEGGSAYSGVGGQANGGDIYESNT